MFRPPLILAISLWALPFLPWWGPIPEADLFLAFSESHFQLGIQESDPVQKKTHFAFAGINYWSYLKKWPNPAWALNAGNCSLLADDLPAAIWAYRRGLQLAPDDAELAANLAFARSQVIYPNNRGRPEEHFWPAGVPYPSLRWTVLWTMFFHGLSWFLVLGWWRTKSPFLGWSAIASVVLTLFLGGFWWFQSRQLGYEERFPVVVVAEDNVDLRLGNGVSYPRHPDLPTLQRGMEARRLRERGEWLQIRFATGEVGWVAKKSVIGV